MGILYFCGTLVAVHVISMVMAFFLPDRPGFHGTDGLGFIGLMLLLGCFVYGLFVMITGDAFLVSSIVYLICYTLVYIFVLIRLSRPRRFRRARISSFANFLHTRSFALAKFLYARIFARASPRPRKASSEFPSLDYNNPDITAAVKELEG